MIDPETARGPEIPLGAAPPSAGEDAVSGAVLALAEDPRERRRRRRKVILLLFLAFLVGVLVLFTAWYLVTRKPISEIPLPVITQESLPHYVFSVYGVTRPMGVAVSPSGDRIYVTETEGERVVRVFDGKGNQVGTMSPPSTTGTEHVPVYLALDPQNGDVYVSDRPTGSIYVYSGDGVFRHTLRPRDPKLAGWQPLGLAFDAQGQLWVTDVSGPYNRVHAITRDGQVVRTIGDPGMFSFPNGVAVDASGNVYVTDSNHGRLMVFDPAGKQRSLIPQGSAAGDLGSRRARPSMTVGVSTSWTRRRTRSSSTACSAKGIASPSTSVPSASRAWETAASSSRSAWPRTRVPGCTSPTGTTTASKSGATE
jgi:DNA-binding beta-propeller fold protein YncE